MKTHLPHFSTRQARDLAIRLEYAAQRREADKARRETPEHTRLVCPDTAPLLNAILTSEACLLRATVSAEQARTKRDGLSPLI